MAKKKQSKKQQIDPSSSRHIEPSWRPSDDTEIHWPVKTDNKEQIVEATPQSLAEGFRGLAKMIGRDLNRYVHRQQESEFEALCERYRGQAQVLWEHARDIGITLPPIHTLSGDTDYKVLKSMRTWCENAAMACDGNNSNTHLEPTERDILALIAKAEKLRERVKKYDESFLNPVEAGALEAVKSAPVSLSEIVTPRTVGL